MNNLGRTITITLGATLAVVGLVGITSSYDAVGTATSLLIALACIILIVLGISMIAYSYNSSVEEDNNGTTSNPKDISYITELETEIERLSNGYINQYNETQQYKAYYNTSTERVKAEEKANIALSLENDELQAKFNKVTAIQKAAVEEWLEKEKTLLNSNEELLGEIRKLTAKLIDNSPKEQEVQEGHKD